MHSMSSRYRARWLVSSTIHVMDDVDGPPPHDPLTFHGPLSEGRAARMIGRLTSHTDVTTVLDIGSG